MHEMPVPPAADPKRQSLLLTLCALFIGFFVTAELLGAKLWHFTLFGLNPHKLGLSDPANPNGAWFIATTGILAFPLTFILTDIINEYFGRRVVRTFTWLAIMVNVILQSVVQAAIRVDAHDFATGGVNQAMNDAFQNALGQSWAIVVASLVAFMVGQFLDIWIFTKLRHMTGGKYLWLRSQGSTVVSQLIDTFVVIFLAFVIIPSLVKSGNLFSMKPDEALMVSVTNYVYKFAIAVLITPILYLVHFLVDSWLGKETAEELVNEAHPSDPV